MSGVIRYAALNSKIRKMKSDLLEDKDFKTIIKKNSVEEIGKYLYENTSYKDVIESYKEIERGELERYINNYMMIQMKKLMYYFYDDYKKFFNNMFLRVESEFVKFCLRKLMNEKKMPDHIEDYESMGFRFKIEELKKVKTIEQFIESLKGTHYHELLKPILSSDYELKLFRMEMNIDIKYFETLYKEAKKLEKKDKEIIEILLGENVDMLNLQFIYRAKKYFKMNPQEIMNYVIPGGLKLKRKDLRELVDKEGVDIFFSKQVKRYYREVFEKRENFDAFLDMNIQKHLYRHFLSMYEYGNLNIIEAVMYMHMLEYQNRDIIAIIECIRYDFDKKEIPTFLVRDLRKEES